MTMRSAKLIRDGRDSRAFPRHLAAVALGLASCLSVVGASGQTPPPASGATARPGFPADVRDPLDGEAPIAKKKEHCSADADHLAAIGRAAGQQVRITRPGGEIAAYTVKRVHEGGGRAVIGMGRLGRSRLGASGAVKEFEATVSADVVRSELTDAEAKDRGEFVERLDDDGTNTGLLVMAPHGGEIEVPTDLQAERVAAQLGGKKVSVWRCKGYGKRGVQGAFERWHITSTETHEASFPLLAKVATRKFDHAVSFHGMVDGRILVGGIGPTRLKVEIRDAIREAIDDPSIPVDIAMQGEANGGTSPDNIVNRYSKGTGIQIEQSPKARREHWEKIADAVARVYRSKL